MSDLSKIAANQVVTIHYTLKGDDGQVIDTSDGGTPLEYLHGAQNIVPGLEKELEGKAIGDALAVRVEPKDGYGIRDESAIVQVERAAFPSDAQLEEGLTFHAMDENEQPMIGTIVKIEGDQLTVDFNHPLAGEALNFDVKVEAIREATAEEQNHGHAHGEGQEHDH